MAGDLVQEVLLKAQRRWERDLNAPDAYLRWVRVKESATSEIRLS